MLSTLLLRHVHRRDLFKWCVLLLLLLGSAGEQLVLNVY